MLQGYVAGFKDFKKRKSRCKIYLNNPLLEAVCVFRPQHAHTHTERTTGKIQHERRERCHCGLLLVCMQVIAQVLCMLQRQMAFLELQKAGSSPTEQPDTCCALQFGRSHRSKLRWSSKWIKGAGSCTPTSSTATGQGRQPVRFAKRSDASCAGNGTVAAKVKAQTKSKQQAGSKEGPRTSIADLQHTCNPYGATHGSLLGSQHTGSQPHCSLASVVVQHPWLTAHCRAAGSQHTGSQAHCSLATAVVQCPWLTAHCRARVHSGSQHSGSQAHCEGSCSSLALMAGSSSASL